MGVWAHNYTKVSAVDADVHGRCVRLSLRGRSAYGRAIPKPSNVEELLHKPLRICARALTQARYTSRSSREAVGIPGSLFSTDEVNLGLAVAPGPSCAIDMRLEAELLRQAVPSKPPRRFMRSRHPHICNDLWNHCEFVSYPSMVPGILPSQLACTIHLLLAQKHTVLVQGQSSNIQCTFRNGRTSSQKSQSSLPACSSSSAPRICCTG